MTIYQWFCLFSVPAILAAVFKILFTQIKAIKLGLQALLRAQLIADWNKWSEKGYAPIYARENFENCWVQYHALGANGVMNNIHIRFFELPTEPPEDEEKAREESLAFFFMPLLHFLHFILHRLVHSHVSSGVIVYILDNFNGVDTSGQLITFKIKGGLRIRKLHLIRKHTVNVNVA